MELGQATSVGKRRTINQDSYITYFRDGVFIGIIADGMGGHKAGDIASKMGVDICYNYLLSHLPKSLEDKGSINELLCKAIEKANKEIYNKSIASKNCENMGTTIIISIIIGKDLYVAHVGDSRAYIKRDEGLYQVTEDQSLVNQLLKEGTISKEEAKNHPQKNMLTRAVGTSQDIDVDIINITISKDEYLLLCTDGLTNMVNDNQILDIINKELKAQDICNKLVELANFNGGYDNITVVVYKTVNEVQ